MKYEKFDVERALAGEPVILRNGTKAYVRYREEEVGVGLPLVGVELGRERWETWTLSGSIYSNGHNYDYDIVGMYPKEPLTMPDSFWNMLRPEIEANAKNENGIWQGFKRSNLSYVGGVWGDGLVHFPLIVFPQGLFPDCNPEDSLIVRPSSGGDL